jgi:hypothetical protein
MRLLDTRRHRLPALLAAAWLAIGLAGPAAASRLQPAPITDGTGFGEPLTAATLDIPADWRTRGGVVWNHGTNCVNNKVRFDWQARSRDDLQGIELMPGYSWQVQGTAIQMNPCPQQPFRSARDFLMAVVQLKRSGAQVLDWRDRPDIAGPQLAQAQAQARVQARWRVESGQVLIGYRSEGVEFRELLSTTVTFSEVQGNVMGGASGVFSYRAPAGRLDFAAAERAERSFRVDPRWGQMMVAALKDSERRFSTGQRQAIEQWHAREMARINAEGAADRAAIRAATSRELARIGSETHANTMATNDRMHRRNLEAVGEYNTYRTPEGHTVRSSIHGGQRVLQSGSGAVFSTDDPYFNPAGSRELQRVR